MPTLDFRGKTFIYTHHLGVPYRELLAVPEKSLPAKGCEPDLDDNLIIHGDNLEALKALLPRYAGKVDVVCIDPPYNIGGDWSYNDAVDAPLMREWLKRAANPVERDDLQRHDKWTCMMWPRLTLLKELMRTDGLIMVAIDDNEVFHLGKLLDEIFGEENCVACAPWLSEPSGGKEKTGLRGGHEYILIYHNGDASAVTSDIRDAGELDLTDKTGSYRKGRELMKWGGTSLRKDRKGQWYPLPTPYGTEAWPIRNDAQEGHWRWGKENPQIKMALEDPEYFHWELRPFDSGKEYKGATERHVPYVKIRSESKSVGWGTWLDSHGYNSDATRELKAMFGVKVFETPKPSKLMQWLIALHANTDALVLDAFAGSGSSAHGSLLQNSEDGGQRKFILIQMPEAIPDDKSAYALGFRQVIDITAERVRRVISGYEYEGTATTELHPPEKITWTSFSKSKTRDQILDRIEGIENLERANYDSVEKKITDGVLTIVGKKKITERMPGLGGSFTYVELGEAMDLERLLAETPGTLPNFASLARYLFFTATGHTIPAAENATVSKAKKKSKSKAKKKAAEPLPDDPVLIGETDVWRVYLHYRPDEEWLRSPAAALTRSQAEALDEVRKKDAPAKQVLVFAAAKYISHRSLRELRVEFAQLPYALHRVQSE